jgi:hypothetical protein
MAAGYVGIPGSLACIFRSLAIVHKLRRIDQKIRLVAGKLRFFPCRINGGMARAIEKEVLLSFILSLRLLEQFTEELETQITEILVLISVLHLPSWIGLTKRSDW